MEKCDHHDVNTWNDYKAQQVHEDRPATLPEADDVIDVEVTDNAT